MRFDVVTLFPEMFSALRYGVVGRALQRGLIDLRCWNPRDYTRDVHRTVDDRPFGGGPGMVMKYQPLADALADVRRIAPDARVLCMSPQGRRLDQNGVAELATRGGDMVLIAGRYEGLDERFVEAHVDEQWSIGDYVLSGGELPAMVLIDAVTRLLPGVLGHADSATQDSFSNGLLECPHYTRPEIVAGVAVPAVLTSGDHQAIRRWRLRESLGRTWRLRPDLLENRSLSDEERRLLDEYIAALRSAETQE